MGNVVGWLRGAVGRRDFAYSEPETRRPKVGVALSGGFARGITHIGVLRVLEENEIPIDYLAGTSVGALIAAAYASGSPLDEMEMKASATRFRDFGRWTLSRLGLASNERLESFLRRFTTATRFEELRIPLAIAATDLLAGKTVIFTQGALGVALRASCAYPGLFLPVMNGGRTLVDGFLTAPVPVDAVRELGAELVIAVHLAGGPTDQNPSSVVEVIGRAFSILQQCADQQWRSRADVIIEPGILEALWDDFEKTPELIAAGEAAARHALPRIREALASWRAPRPSDRQ